MRAAIKSVRCLDHSYSNDKVTMLLKPAYIYQIYYRNKPGIHWYKVFTETRCKADDRPLTATSNSAAAFPTELVAVTLTLPVLRPVSDFKVSIDCPSVVSMTVVDDAASGSSLRLHSTLGAGMPPTLTGIMRLAPAFSCCADLNFAS